MPGTLRPLPSLNYSQLPTYFDTRSFSLPAHRRFVLTPSIHRPESYFLNGGITHVSFNPGDEAGIARTPAAQRCLLLGSGIWSRNRPKAGVSQQQVDAAVAAKDFSKSRPLSDFTQAEVIADITNAVNGFGGAGVIADQFGEFYRDDIPWGLSPDMAQYHWCYEALEAANFAKTGTRFGSYGAYGGHMRVESVTSDFNKNEIAGKRDAFTNDGAALSFAKTASGTGDRYFTDEHWRFRSGFINGYYNGWTEPGKRLFQMLTNLWIDMRAKRGAGAVDSRTMMFCWAQKQDFNFHHTDYKTPVPGGYTEAESFTSYYPDWQLAIGFFTFLFADLYLWQTGVRNGTDPSRLQPDRTRNDPSGESYRKYFGANNPPREQALTHYDATLNPGYTPDPLGYTDLWCAGAEWFSAAYAHAGGDWIWAPHRPTATPTFRTDNNGAYLLDSYLEDTLIGVVMGSGSKKVLMVVDAGGEPGKWRTWDFQVGAQIHTAELHGQTPYIWFF